MFLNGFKVVRSALPFVCMYTCVHVHVQDGRDVVTSVVFEAKKNKGHVINLDPFTCLLPDLSGLSIYTFVNL